MALVKVKNYTERTLPQDLGEKSREDIKGGRLKREKPFALSFSVFEEALL